MSPCYRPRHRFSTPPPDPSDILFLLLAAATAGLTAFVAGALAAHPF